MTHTRDSEATARCPNPGGNSHVSCQSGSLTVANPRSLISDDSIGCRLACPCDALLDSTARWPRADGMAARRLTFGAATGMTRQSANERRKDRT